MHARIKTKQTPCKTSAFEEGGAVVSKVILQSIALLGADKKRWLSRHYAYRGTNHITVRKTHNCAKTFVMLLTNLQLSLECSVRELCGVLLPRLGAYAQNGCGGNNGECLNANVQDAMSARDPFPIPVT